MSIKMININFNTKTIESIETNGIDTTHYNIKLTENSFFISFPKPRKDRKKKPTELLIESEPEIKNVEPEIKNVSIDEMIEILKKNIQKHNTADTYIRGFKDVANQFKIDNVVELLTTKDKEMIDYIVNKYKDIKTQKTKICCVYKCYKLLNIENELFKTTIKDYIKPIMIENDKEKQENKKALSEAIEMIDYFETRETEINETIISTPSLLDEWSSEVQLSCLLKLYLNYGVLRPGELLDCKIVNNETLETNYIDISKKQLIINVHKNDIKGSKTIDLDDRFIKLVSKGLGKYLIQRKDKKLYKSTSSFTKFFKRMFNDYTPYDLRKAISSKCIHDNDLEEIAKLEYIQGHSLKNILDYYNVYDATQKN
jgi:hypothetical protein